MPIYEYACENCGCKLEVFQGMQDVPLSVCQECHRPSLVKLVSAAGFRLKGGGWYETDFKKDGDKKKNLVNEGESASSGSASATTVSDKSSTVATPSSNTNSSSTNSTSSSEDSKA